MPQFMIQAIDYTDENALQRRMMAREEHLARMKGEKEKGIFILGGATLNQNNQMMGSVIIVSLPDEQSVWGWTQTDVYVREKVWEDIRVLPFRVADV